MTNTLPTEIITNIATYLSQRKLCTCLRVCRSWYAALIPVLYSNVNIQTKGQLNQFVETLQSTETSKSLGHRVRKLMLGKWLLLVEIAPLPRLCPYVVSLSWKTHEWDSDLAKILQEWKYLERVKRITFHEGRLEFPTHALQDKITVLSIHIGKYPKWIDYITKLPGIKELELTCVRYMENDGLKVSLDELELLHQALPRLEIFSIDGIVIQGEIPGHITPCSSVRTLRLESIDGHLWGQYFAQKYTNLEKLLMYEMLDKTEAITLARSCRRIKSLTSNEFRYTREARPFFETFQQIGAPIEHLYMVCSDLPLHAAFVGRFCGTLTHVKLSFNWSVLNEVIKPLRACPLLVKLELYNSSDEAHAEVDRILDYWKHLKHLRLTMHDILLSDDCTTNTQHDLKTLRLDGRVHQDVFPHLSQRCSRLSEFDISFGKEERPPRVIYIPNPNIERLSVTFFELRDYIFKLTWIDKSEQTSAQRKQFAEEVLKRRDQKACCYSMKWIRSDEDDYYLAIYGLESLGTPMDEPWKKCETESDKTGNRVVWIQCYNLDRVFLRDGMASY